MTTRVDSAGSGAGAGPSRRDVLRVAGAGAAALLLRTSIPPERAYAGALAGVGLKSDI